ncbi:MAG: class I SAM-dependent methyltransferase [Phycisphaerae bacterium]|nr:class I SAM-dependent methyltransferase [Phycisphaerae bacterium]
MRTLGQAEGATFIAAEATPGEFDLSLDGATLTITPRQSRPFRRTLRPVAHFEVDTPQGPYPELNLTMGRIVFEGGQTDSRSYRPFSRDPVRSLRALYLGPELPTEDDPAYFNAVCADHAARLPHEDHAWVRVLPSTSEGTSSRAKRLEYLHYHAHGWFHLVEMDLLDAMTRASVLPGKHVIEIGSYQGRSTAVIAAALGDLDAESLVIAVDPNELSEQQADVTAANVASVGQRKRLVQIQRRAGAIASLLADEVAHLTFVDGSHLYEHVLADFQLCDRLLAPGGIMVFHDVYAPAHLGYEPPRSGPARVVNEVVLPTGRYKPLAGAHLALALRKLD